MYKDDIQTKLSRFLLCYRNMPNSTTDLMPTELFLKRRTRTRLDLLRPNVTERVSQSQANAKQHKDKKASAHHFELWETVFVENIEVQGQPKWIPGTIVERMGGGMRTSLELEMNWIYRLMNGTIRYVVVL